MNSTGQHSNHLVHSTDQNSTKWCFPPVNTLPPGAFHRSAQYQNVVGTKICQEKGSPGPSVGPQCLADRHRFNVALTWMCHSDFFPYFLTAICIQIRHISSVRHLLTTQATQALVFSRLDCCNSTIRLPSVFTRHTSESSELFVKLRNLT